MPLLYIHAQFSGKCWTVTIIYFRRMTNIMTMLSAKIKKFNKHFQNIKRLPHSFYFLKVIFIRINLYFQLYATVFAEDETIHSCTK